MGSSPTTKNDSSSPRTKHLPLTTSGVNSFSAICEVTNRIDIDKYFEHLKKECITQETPKSPRRVLRKTVSNSKIEMRSKSSNDKRKRRSIEENILKNPDNNSISPRSAAGYVHYDISEGKMIQCEKNSDLTCLVSRQKSWDLNISKKRSHLSHIHRNQFTDNFDMTTSYSEGDFKDFLNNNQMVQSSKSCDDLLVHDHEDIDLSERHKEHAMNHGKISSVSEQNRRLRKKYFNKGRKSSDERQKKDINNEKSIKNENEINDLVENLNLHKICSPKI